MAVAKVQLSTEFRSYYLPSMVNPSPQVPEVLESKDVFKCYMCPITLVISEFVHNIGLSEVACYKIFHITQQYPELFSSVLND